MHVVLSPPVPLRTAAASATLRAGGAAFLSHPWRGRALALAGLYGGICLFFGLVWVTGRAESPLSLASSGVFLTLRLLAVGAGFWKLRQARFDVRQPLHWMLLVFTLSMLLASAGTLTWLTYNWVGVLVPYPSLADLGFGGHTLLWAVGLFLLYAALGTTPREEVGPFLGLLTATWSLTVVLISLIHGGSWATEELPKLALDIFYPFMWALSAALAGSLVFGLQYKRCTGRWRAVVVVVYAACLVLFLTNIAYTITAASPSSSPAAKYLYYNGGPLDFCFATGNYLLLLAVVLLPLRQPLLRTEPPHQHAAEAVHPVSTQPQSHGSPAPAAQPHDQQTLVHPTQQQSAEEGMVVMVTSPSDTAPDARVQLEVVLRQEPAVARKVATTARRRARRRDRARARVPRTSVAANRTRFSRRIAADASDTPVESPDAFSDTIPPMARMIGL